MTDPVTSQPQTTAGRALWAHWNTEALEASRWQFYLEAILAIEAEASKLNVERLGTALDVLSGRGLDYALMAPEERADRFEAAEALAAEYARLAAEEQG